MNRPPNVFNAAGPVVSEAGQSGSVPTNKSDHECTVLVSSKSDPPPRERTIYRIGQFGLVRLTALLWPTSRLLPSSQIISSLTLYLYLIKFTDEPTQERQLLTAVRIGSVMSTGTLCVCLYTQICPTNALDDIVRYLCWIIVQQLLGAVVIMLGSPSLGMLVVNTAVAAPRLARSEFVVRMAGHATRIWNDRN